jgi:hypothetical protein
MYYSQTSLLRVRLFRSFISGTSGGRWTCGISAREILANGCNLDRKNPSTKDDITHLPPAKLATSILEKEQKICEIVGRIQKLLLK